MRKVKITSKKLQELKNEYYKFKYSMFGHKYMFKNQVEILELKMPYWACDAQKIENIWYWIEK